MTELAVGGAGRIVKAGLAINKAVKTVRQNKKECQDIDKFVGRVSNILSWRDEMTTEMMMLNPEIAATLVDLAESIEEASELITDCQKKKALWRRLIAAGEMAKQLDRLKADIQRKMDLATFATTIYISVQMRNALRDISPHPPSTQLQEAESLEVDLQHDMEMEICDNNPIRVFEDAAHKIHRYPPSMRCIGEWCTVPTIVAIGPYHHGKRQLNHVEKVKHVAAYYCISNSGYAVEELYHAVVSVVVEIDARRLYNEDVMEGMGDDKFLHMMFFDACFLVMYMLKWSGEECNAMLYDFFESNANDIDHDLMLLENQIPWPVVDAIMNRYKAVPLAKFIENWKCGRLQDRVYEEPTTPVLLDDSYEPPHLLGLLRFHIVGKNRTLTGVQGLEKMKSIGVSVSAIELAKMGIILTANKTTELADMGLTKKPIFAELSMAPLSLNDLRISLLINMAALELRTTPDFFDEGAKYEDSAACSYLLLLCLFIHEEEDVHELRRKGILQGGAGLTNKEALDFFKSLQSLRVGRCCVGRCCARVMEQIENYRNERPMWIKVYGLFYNNWKTILTVISAIGVFSILGAINSLKGAH